MDEQAFLRTILAYPADDAPRLIYADWLVEQGDEKSLAKAEFLRHLCGTDPREAERAEIEHRRDEEWRRMLNFESTEERPTATAKREVLLLERASKFESEWIAVVGKMRIYGCPLSDTELPLPLSFNLTMTLRNVCDRNWEDLQAVEGDVRRRRCGECGKDVFLCETNDAMEEHGKAGEGLALGPATIDPRRFIESLERRTEERAASTRRPRTGTRRRSRRRAAGEAGEVGDP